MCRRETGSQKQMTTMIRKLLFMMLMSVPFVESFARDNDFGIWYNVSTDLKIIRGIELDLEGSLRTFDNASKIEEGFLETGLNFKVTDYLSLGAAYRFGENIEDDDKFHIRHKWFADARVKLPFRDLEFSGRVRFQQRYKTYFEDKNDREPKEHIRLRIKALYDIPSFPINPYLTSELFLPVFDHVKRTVDKQRFAAGFEYKIARKHSIDLEYIFQRDFFPDLMDMNIISVNYSFKF